MARFRSFFARALSNASIHSNNFLRHTYNDSTHSNLAKLKLTTKVPTKRSLTNCVRLKPTKEDQNLYIKVSLTSKRENTDSTTWESELRKNKVQSMHQIWTQ